MKLFCPRLSCSNCMLNILQLSLVSLLSGLYVGNNLCMHVPSCHWCWAAGLHSLVEPDVTDSKWCDSSPLLGWLTGIWPAFRCEARCVWEVYWFVTSVQNQLPWQAPRFHTDGNLFLCLHFCVYNYGWIWVCLWLVKGSRWSVCVCEHTLIKRIQLCWAVYKWGPRAAEHCSSGKHKVSVRGAGWKRKLFPLKAWMYLDWRIRFLDLHSITIVSSLQWSIQDVEQEDSSLFYQSSDPGEPVSNLIKTVAHLLLCLAY